MRYIYILIAFVFLTLAISCAKTEDTLTESNLDTETPSLNATDIWLRGNYTSPYNIEVFYNWNENRVDFNRYLFPPTVEKVKPAMEAVKAIWLETYREVAGDDFVKLIAPREILLIGGINLNPSGTITLGLAEGGKRITFFNTDLVDLKDRNQLIRFVSTIQHEYTHIINQTVPFDEETFGPLAAMIKAKSIEEAFDLSEQSKYGLGVTVCTQNIEKALSFSDRVSDGAYFINELVKSDPRLPFGGTKKSGYGRELAKDGMMEFVNRKTVYVK